MPPSRCCTGRRLRSTLTKPGATTAIDSGANAIQAPSGAMPTSTTTAIPARPRRAARASWLRAASRCRLAFMLQQLPFTAACACFCIVFITSPAGPNCCTRPASSTRILSTWAMSDGRCVTTIEVTPSRAQAAQRLRQRDLARAVEVGVRLVEHHQARVAVQRARQRHALALARRQARAVLADRRVVALRQREDHLVRDRRAWPRRRPPRNRPWPGARCCRPRCRRTAPRPAARSRSSAPRSWRGQCATFGAVQAHRAGGRRPDAGQQARQRGLAGRARPDDRQRLARARG